MADYQGRLDAVNLGPSVGVDLKSVTDRLFLAVIVLTRT